MTEKNMIKVTGIISHHCINSVTLRISALKKAGVNYKKLPQYCTLEIDLNSIQEREKGRIKW